MKQTLYSVAILLALMPTILAQDSPTKTSDKIPNQLWGTWRITKIIDTRTISCWDYNEARLILGTRIEYSATSFRWKNLVVPNPDTSTTVLSADQFHTEYSGGGAADSQVDFQQLGIKTPSVILITINHPDADITHGGSTEIPGDVVLVKNLHTLIFSVCNVYFTAIRVQPTKQK